MYSLTATNTSIIMYSMMLIPMPKVIKTVSDFQRRTKPTFEEIAQSDTPVLVLNRNKQVGVFLNPKLYAKLLEFYEDYLDALDLEKASQAKNQEFLPLKAVNKKRR